MEAWNERGLNPSDPSLCSALSTGFNGTAMSLMEGLQSNNKKSQLKSILYKSIADCKTLELDTEEKEFAVDLYTELSYVVGVDLSYRLSVFLYGHLFTILNIITKFFKPERVRKIHRQRCTKCNEILEAHILKIDPEISERDWVIGKCSNCNEYNLFSHGPAIKHIRYRNYAPVERLPMDEFSHEQAISRLEQIQYFRK